MCLFFRSFTNNAASPSSSLKRLDAVHTKHPSFSALLSVQIGVATVPPSGHAGYMPLCSPIAIGGHLKVTLLLLCNVSEVWMVWGCPLK